MTLELRDDLVSQAGMSEREIRIELACRLFDIQKLHLWPAAQLAGMGRYEFEDECGKRDIPVYRFDLDESMESEIEYVMTHLVKSAAKPTPADG